ncbi:MAG: hypothetical protein J6J86_07660, partial [Lachnospiraceae bacterium]|nr:hypothetical protein [Lachnospiraceae bacterium]
LKAEVNNNIPKPSEEKKNALISFLKADTDSEDSVINVEEVLCDIIDTLDYKIDKAVSVYKKILSVDLSELEDIFEDVSVFCGYGVRARRFLKKRMCDTDIYPYLYLKRRDIFDAQMKSMRNQTSLYSRIQAWRFVAEDNSSSAKNTVKRIYYLQRRAQRYIEKTFEMYNIEELKKYDKKELLEGLLALQYVFFGIDKMEIRAKTGDAGRKITFSYNKFIYYIENLNRLLLFDIINRYKFLDKTNFAMKADRFEKGTHVCFKGFSPNDINPDIYRL